MLRWWPAVVVCGSVLCVVTITTSSAAQDHVHMNNPPADTQFIDLTHQYRNGMIVYPGHPEYNMTVANKGNWGQTNIFVYSNKLDMSEHTGTHMDAPSHFSRGGPNLDQISLAELQGPGVVINVVEKAKEDGNYELQVSDLEDWEDKHGRIPSRAIIMMRTDWSKYFQDRARFFGTTRIQDKSTFQWPGFGAAASKWLAVNRKPNVVAVETISIDNGISPDFAAHRILLKDYNISGIENIANLDKLPEFGSWVYAFPMNIHEGSGGPVRVFAVIGAAAIVQPSLLLAIIFAIVVFLIVH